MITLSWGRLLKQGEFHFGLTHSFRFGLDDKRKVANLISSLFALSWNALVEMMPRVLSFLPHLPPLLFKTHQNHRTSPAEGGWEEVEQSLGQCTPLPLERGTKKGEL